MNRSCQGGLIAPQLELAWLWVNTSPGQRLWRGNLTCYLKYNIGRQSVTQHLASPHLVSSDCISSVHAVQMGLSNAEVDVAMRHSLGGKLVEVTPFSSSSSV